MHADRLWLARPCAKAFLKLFTLSLIAFAVMAPGSLLVNHSLAFSQEPEARQIRVLRNSDHPIAIKQIRNAHTSNFLQDVEIEIQNVSDKPVYYAWLSMRFPDIKVDQVKHYAFGLSYGDLRLDRIAELAGPLDQPIPPGGTVTLRVPSAIRDGFDWYKSDARLPSAEPNQVEIRLEEVSFGDGTGYEYGRLYPRPSR